MIERDVNDLQTNESRRSTGGDQSSVCVQGPGCVAPDKRVGRVPIRKRQGSIVIGINVQGDIREGRRRNALSRIHVG